MYVKNNLFQTALVLLSDSLNKMLTSYIVVTSIDINESVCIRSAAKSHFNYL